MQKSTVIHWFMSETPKSYPPCIPILMETVLCWYHDTLPRLPFSALNLLSSNETIYNKFSLFSFPFPLYKCYFHVGVVVHVVILMQCNLIWYTSELFGTPLKKFIRLKFTYLSSSNWLLRVWHFLSMEVWNPPEKLFSGEIGKVERRLSNIKSFFVFLV